MSDERGPPDAADAPSGPGELFTPDDLARLFRCTTRTLRNWVRAGLLDPIRIRGRVYFDRRKVERLINAREK